MPSAVASQSPAKTSGGGSVSYYVPYATRTIETPVDLRASAADGRAAARRVELPREPVAVEDLVLREPERLHVRVVDLAGAPMAQVTLTGDRRPLPTTSRCSTSPARSACRPR